MDEHCFLQVQRIVKDFMGLPVWKSPFDQAGRKPLIDPQWRFSQETQPDPRWHSTPRSIVEWMYCGPFAWSLKESPHMDIPAHFSILAIPGQAMYEILILFTDQ